MRLTGIFLLAASLHVTTILLSQTVTVSVRHATVQEVFEIVKRQTGYSFFYDKAMLDGARPISMKAKNLSLDEFMSIALQNQPFTYYVENQTIFLRKRTPAPANSTPAVTEQRRPSVTGLITDINGQPLTGANVTIKETGRGTATDSAGRFSIEARMGEILVISSIGFESREVQASSAVVNVMLQGHAQSMNEVIITALGISKVVKSLTYSAQNVKGDQINEAKEVNLVNGLQGKVAGLTVTRNADGPGGEAKVLIRGNRSITGNNDPLYVIDGVPLSGNVGMLNSDDIESLTVLKGASAAALYGSQGQNGAIIITTKKGNDGPLTVNYALGLTIDKALVLPELQFEYGQGDAGIFDAHSEHSWGPRAEGQLVTLWDGNTVPLKGQPDNLRNFFRSATTLSNSVTVAGGTKKMQTYFSYGNTRAQGILRNNDLIRHNVDLKIDNTISPKLSFFTKLTYIYEAVNNRVIPGDAGTYTLPSIFRSPTSIPLADMQRFAYTDSNGIEQQNYWKPQSSVLLNPYWGLNRITYYQQRDRAIGLFSAKYKFTAWLDLQIRASIDKTYQQTNHKIYAGNYFSLVGSDYETGSSINTGTSMDALLSVRRDLTEKLNLSANFGAASQESRYSTVDATANGLNKQNFFFMNNARNPFTNETYGRTPRVQSLYSTITLSYKGLLYLDATARNDWSSALPAGARSYFYPTLGVSSIVSEIFHLPSWVSYGKFRATLANSGYGGNQYLDRNYYQVGPGGVISTPTIEALGNYKPELTNSFETGLEGRILKNRFSFNIVYYSTKTKNQLLLIGAPPGTTFDQKYINAGLIRNRGIELMAGANLMNSGRFIWDADLNYSKNNNKVLQMTPDVKSAILVSADMAEIRAVEGNAFGDIYAKGWQTDAQGRRLVDNAGNPIYTVGNDVRVGNYNPNYMMAMNNTLAYSAFSLSFLIDYRNGGSIIAGTKALLDADGISRQSLEGRENGIVLDAYTADGKKNTIAIDAQTYWFGRGGRYPIGSLYAYSATNMRLRELIFSYALPSSIVGKGKVLKAAKLSLVGRNLFFIMRSAPVDPEIIRGITGGGLEYAALPSTRSMGVNVKFSF